MPDFGLMRLNFGVSMWKFGLNPVMISCDVRLAKARAAIIGPSADAESISILPITMLPFLGVAEAALDRARRQSCVKVVTR